MLSITPSLRFPSHEEYITFLFFCCVCMLVWVKINNPKRIPAILVGFFARSDNTGKSGKIEENTISFDSIALFFVFLTSFVILLMQTLQLHNATIRTGRFEEFVILIFALIAWYLLKTFAVLLCGFIFGVQGNARDYINEIFVFTHFTGLILLPIAVFVTFTGFISPVITEKCVLGLWSLLVIYRTLKIFILMTNKGLSIVYLFLYLCSLEIIPLVLLFEYCHGRSF